MPFAPSLKGHGFRKRDGAGPGGRHRLCAGRTAAAAPPCARADAAPRDPGFITVRFVTSAKCTERRGCRCGHPPLQGSAASGTSACCAAVTAGFRTLSSSPADTLSPLHTPQPPPRSHPASCFCSWLYPGPRVSGIAQCRPACGSFRSARRPHGASGPRPVSGRPSCPTPGLSFFFSHCPSGSLGPRPADRQVDSLAASLVWGKGFSAPPRSAPWAEGFS